MSCDVKIVSKYKLLCQSETGCLFYKKGRLYFSKFLDQRPEKIGELKLGLSKKILSRIRLTERILRLEPRFAVPYHNGFLVTWNGAMRFVDVNTGKIKRLHTYRPGVNNPLGIVKLEGIPGFTDGYVYGDYWGNTKKEGVCIYRIRDFSVECVYTFCAGQILHIHGITADPQNGRVLVCTGDLDAESGIWEARDDFKVMKPLLKGSQSYRTCAAYPTEAGILYATDTPLADNGIYILEEGCTDVRKLYDMPGPCIYSKRVVRAGKTDVYIFATSVEPDSRLKSGRYKITYRLGPGVKSRWVHIIAGNPQEGFRTVHRMKKDIFPMLLFQFGNSTFPDTPSEAPLMCTPISVKRYDGKTLQLKLGE